NVNQDLDAILKLILKKTITVVNTPYGLIILFDRDSAIIKYIGLGFPQDVKLESLCETVISRLKQERKVIFLKLDSDSGLDGYFTELKLSQALCIPFLKKDYVSGALCFFLTDEHESLSDEQLRVLNIVAENSVRVIENARLYQSEREKELLKQEMELARNVQQNLLSEGDMQISAFEITSHNTPSLEVSGDYYDVIKLDDNRVMVSIADVSGKGMSAALLMANLQAAVRSLIHEHYSIDELVNKMNNLIFESTESSAYITFFISIINTTNGEMEYVNAGHNPPLIFRHDGENNNIEYLKTGGLLLGWLKNIQYSKGTAKIEIDDILLLYTDGLTEAMNLNEEEFGEERLISEILLHRTLSGGEIKTTVLSSVAQFTRGEMQSDDITMVIVKRNK
ncbi:SpoIIE family protein phosphatase, partial [bacterium]|nr:SpoIIE family protein phosphatase [bacterium]